MLFARWWGHEKAVVLAAVLDDERPAVRIVNHLVAKRQFRSFVQPNVARLLNQVSSVRDCLLSAIHHVGFRLVNVSRWVYRDTRSDPKYAIRTR